MRSTPAQIARSERIDQQILRARAETDFAKQWYALALAPEQREVAVALTLHLLAGEPKPPSLAAAAKDCGVPSATARSWKHRSQVFGLVVDAIVGRWTKPEPIPEPEPTPPPPPVTDLQLKANVEKWRKAVKYERLRYKNGKYADPRRAERQLERAERELYVFNLLDQRERPSTPLSESF